ncbi:MAG: DoxX family protein [Phycisphaerales bacterium JB039]
MSKTIEGGAGSKRKRVGWLLTGLSGAFLLLDAAGKFMRPEAVVEAMGKLGYEASVITPLGFVLAACTALALFPRTAVVGAILLTGYLGGAVATHVRVGNPLFSHALFPVYIGAMIWLGLQLRGFELRPPRAHGRAAAETKLG